LALIPGTRLGVYEVTAQIGEGGMGQVYRATDTKLKRQVAIKILPPSLAADHDRLTRFQREAEVLASLNHPNIAAIYGLEESAGITALVMELVEGETLDERIRHGSGLLADGYGRSRSSTIGDQPSAISHQPSRGLDLDEALAIAKQIADALEAAHEQGIIHRDLKPANIKVRSDGMVKVLDFGLAKAMDTEGAGQVGGAGKAGKGDLTQSPTITTPAMTRAGMILGTAAYMSPEQARGKFVDKRADIWAFGIVVFEMVTGRRAFEGDDISVTLASVLMKDPDWSALPAAVPAGLRRLLTACLKKDPKARMRDIGEARQRIEELLSGGPEEISTPALPTVAAPLSLVGRVLPWAVAVMFGIALIGALVVWSPWRSAPVPTPRKLLASIGADASLPTDLGASAILSPDGTTLAFVAQQSGQTRLFVRKLDQLQAAALAGTEGAASPFFSPYGQWIAFFAGGKLKKVSVTGGAAINLCDAPSGRGGTWTDDDTIIFTPTGGAGPNTRLMRIPAAGGIPAVFGTFSEGAATQRWPQALPGGKAVLYTEHSSGAAFDGANLVAAPLAGGKPKVVVHGGYYGRYVPSDLASSTRGHLIYMQQGTLFAVRFDLGRLETIGQAMPAIEGVTAYPGATGGAQLAFSSDGTFVYVPGAGVTTANPTDWMTRDGKTSVLRATKADWWNPRFSPDGQKLALEISDGKQSDIWVYEWARDTLTQLTFDPGQDRFPAWTPDGRRIVFASDRAKAGALNLYWVKADGTGDVTRLTDSSENHFDPSWHPTGKFLVFTAGRGGATGNDLMILPMEGDDARGWKPGKPTVFLSTPANEVYPMFSPDGRWVAYASTEVIAGPNDVYVRPFPGPGGKWRVSTEGGVYPRWSTTTHELLFLNNQSKVMFAPYAVVGDSFRADRPQIWSPTGIRGARIGNSAYDLHPDGKRLAAAAAQDQGSGVQDKVVFVFNFADYLRKIAPGTK